MKSFITLQHKEFRYPNKGYCSIVNSIIMNAGLHYLEYGNYNVFTDDNQILDFFENKFKYKEVEEEGAEYFDISRKFLTLFFSEEIKKYDIFNYDSHKPVKKEILLKKKEILDNVLSLKKEILEEFEISSKKFISENTLGIQLRGTDKVTELPEIPIEKIKNKIDFILENNNIDSIFLATDDFKYLSLLSNRYGDLIKYNKKNIISYDNRPIHLTEKDRYNVNKQVLSDVYTLSKCQNFLYCYSNVSYLASIMGVGNFKLLELLN